MTRTASPLLVVATTAHGGLLHYAIQLADGLAAAHDRVELLVPRRHEFDHHVGPATPRPVLPVLVQSIELPPSRWRHLMRRAGVAMRMVLAWLRILAEVVRTRAESVVLTVDLSHPPATLGALALTLLPRGPVVGVVCHNARRFNIGAGDLIREGAVDRLVGRLFARADVVFVHGERTLDDLRRARGERPRVTVVPHGDEGLLAGAPTPPSTDERILFFGDWRKVKGLPELMGAFDKLVARRPSVRLTIAGSPAPADFDPDVVRRWATGHGEHVRVIDRYVPAGEVPALFDSARAVVTPYVIGFQSGVVHLAMTKGRPVVTSDVGDLPRVVSDGVTGRVVPPGDLDALADALEEVVADLELAARWGAAGRAMMAEQADWPSIGEKMAAALAERSRSRPVR